MVSIIIFTLLIIGALGLALTDTGPQDSMNISEDTGLDEISADGDLPDSESYDYPYIPYLPDPTPFTLTQPDGMQFTARMAADRTGGHEETMDGYTIIKDSEGWWTYAIKGEDGVLIPTADRVGDADAESRLTQPKHLANVSPYPDFDESLYRGTRAPPINSTWKGIAIMFEFQDETFDPGHNQAHFSNLLNGTSGATMRNYYREVSYGQFDIEIDVVGPFQSDYVMAYYGDNAGGDRDNANGSISAMAWEAMNKSDPTVDFSPYDIDGDDIIDALFIIHASSGEEQSGYEFDIWSHQSSTFYITNDNNVRAIPYSTEPEDGEIGVFAHEFGHVLGLPDLYDDDYGGSGGQSDGIGAWGIMASGSWNGGGTSPAHFCAWAKVVLGWVEPTIVTSDLSLFQLEIPPVWNNSVIYKIWAHDPSQDTTEYFLVENRQKSGFDTPLPGDGILIWHINESAPLNRNPNRLMVDLEEADGNEALITYGFPGAQAGDVWKNSITGFRHNTNPNSTSYNGSATNVWVWNISTIAPDKNMSVGFNEIYSGPTGIFISDPVDNSTILPVYDFIINDTGFPDEDVGSDGSGNNGSYVLEWRHTNTSDPWNATPNQNSTFWEGGGHGIINCSTLIEGHYDFRVRILDEEGHLYYTPVVYNVAVPSKIPPVANAGPDNITEVLSPIVLDGSGSTDNSGYIAWFNWTFGDGTYHNGTNSIVLHTFTSLGNFSVILNVSDSFGNWDTDIVNITVVETEPPVTTLTIGKPKYRAFSGDYWNITTNLTTTHFNLSAIDNYSGVNFTWYTVDGDCYVYSGNFSLIGYNEGLHNITWGSMDKYGNNETGNSDVIIIDNTPPETILDVGLPRYRNNPSDYWNVTDTTLFTFISSDQQSGPDYVWFMINGTTIYPNGTNFTLAGYGEVLIPILWIGFDHVGNNWARTTWIYLDLSTPVTNLTVGDPKYRDQPVDSWNITDTTSINLSHNFDGEGPGANFTWYTIDGIYYLYSAPFTLSPGTHIITWGSEDLLGLNETGNTITINVDIESPVTGLMIGSPKYKAGGGDDWNVTESTFFTLSPTDSYSGVNFTWYLIDGQYFVGTGFDLSGYSEGPHTLQWGSIDNLDNNETANTILVHLDNSPPVTDIDIGVPQYRMDGINDTLNITSLTPITLITNDGLGCGTNITIYRVYNATYNTGWLVYSGGFTLSNTLNDGLYTIEYYSVDFLGNTELTHIYMVYLDNTPPSTDIAVDDPKFRSNPSHNWNITDATHFTLSSDDGLGSGVRDIIYQIDALAPQIYNGSYFIITEGDGIHSIKYWARDNLFNTETSHEIYINIDNTPPTTNFIMGTPRYQAQPVDLWNITNSTPLSLSNNNDDTGAGVNFTWYSIDGVFYLYTGTFTLPSGEHTITWGSQDNLDLNETGNTLSVNVDDDPPVTNIIVGSPKYRGGGSDSWNVTNDTQFTLMSSDLYSGVDYIWYVIDGQYFQGAIFNLSGYGEGQHTISYGAIDNLGNNATAMMEQVNLDLSPPTTLLPIGNPKYPVMALDFFNVTSATPFILASQDTYSGVESEWYTIDTDYYEGSNFNLLGYAEGMHTITWGARDHLQYNETGNVITVIIDDTPPYSNFTISEPKFRASGNDIWNVTNATIFSFTSVDNSSGVGFMWYTIDSTYFQGSSFDLMGVSQGIITITWGSSDNLGNNETGNIIVVNLIASPIVTDITVGAPRHRALGSDLWNVSQASEFQVILVSDIGGTGVEFYWYTIDGQYFQGDTFDLAGYAEGLHIITWGGRDNIGYNETGNTISVYLDNSPPVTNHVIGSPKYRVNASHDYNVTSATIFTLSASDQYAGVNHTWYVIDGIYYQGSVFNLSGYLDGLHTITYGSIDYLGHNESGTTITVILDDTPPVTDRDISEPKHMDLGGSVWNITSDAVFTLSPSDMYSGVAYTWYTINGSYFVGVVFDLQGYGDGLYTIEWGSVDNLGNIETASQEVVRLRDAPPETSIDVGTPSYRAPGDSWNVTSITTFTLTPLYTPCGIDYTWYTINGQYDEGTTFTLSGLDGAYAITWGSVDNLNHNESANSMIVFLDNTPPVTNLSIDTSKYREEDWDSWNVTSSTQFSLVPSDVYAGVQVTWYFLKGTYYEDTGFDLSGLDDGMYVIYWGALDNLDNNETANQIQVFLDNTPPTTGIEVDSPKYRIAPDENWYVTKETVFTLTASDNLSGVDKTWFRINGIIYQGNSVKLSGLDDGEYTIYWFSRDNLGHSETESNISVILDTLPPVTHRNIGSPQYRELASEILNVTDTTPFTLTPNDKYSGVSRTWYTIDGVYFDGTEFTLEGYEEGLHTIGHGSFDNLDNQETTSTIVVNLDTSPPTTQISYLGKRFRSNPNDILNVTDATTYTLTASDYYTKVSLTWYTIDGVYFEGTEFTLRGYEDGLHTITYGSMDILQNNETGSSVVVYLDNSPPVIFIDVGWPSYVRDNITHIRFSTPISLYAMDYGANNSLIFYSMDGGEKYFEYESEFTVLSTATAILFSGVDVLDNMADDTTFTVIIDITDTDGDGTYNFEDDDDDDDGLLDAEEDLNNNGIVDMDETDPLKADTDGDGHDDKADSYPLDDSQWREPVKWTNIPIAGDMDPFICLGLLIVFAIILIILIWFLRQRRIEKAKESFGKEPDSDSNDE